MKRFKTAKFQLLVLAVLLSLAIPACSGPAAEPTEAPPEETEAAAEPTEEVEPTVEVSADDGSITIMEWSGYEVTENPYLFPKFAEAYTPTLDTVTDYIFFAEDPEAFTKLQSGVHADLESRAGEALHRAQLADEPHSGTPIGVLAEVASELQEIVDVPHEPVRHEQREHPRRAMVSHQSAARSLVEEVA